MNDYATEVVLQMGRIVFDMADALNISSGRNVGLYIGDVKLDTRFPRLLQDSIKALSKTGGPVVSALGFQR